jgi:hypothetical protein
MATAGHRSMQTTKQYLHLAGVVFRDDADAIAQAARVRGSGTNTAQAVEASQDG